MASTFRVLVKLEYSLPDRYTEALQIFKPSQDLPWQASALEGLATITILDAWSAGHGLVGLASMPRTILHD